MKILEWIKKNKVISCCVILGVIILIVCLSYTKVFGVFFTNHNSNLSIDESALGDVSVTSVSISGDSTIKRGSTVTLTVSTSGTGSNVDKLAALQDGLSVLGTKTGISASFTSYDKINVTASSSAVPGSTFTIEVCSDVEPPVCGTKTMTVLGYFTISPSSTNLTLGDSTTLNARFDSNDVTSSATWTSSNDSVVTIDGKGDITGSGEGNAVVTATYTYEGNQYSATCSVTVKEAVPTGVTITGNSTVTVGSNITLSASVSPSAASQLVNWSSSDTSVATVDENGKITGIKAGKVTITATSKALSTVKNTKEITVNPSSSAVPTGVTITGNSTVTVGSNITLSASVSPSAASQLVNWSSSDASVATVDENGKITGIKAGKVTITATSKALSTVKTTKQITVNPSNTNNPSVVISGGKSVLVGKTLQLSATVYPNSASQTVVWTSLNPEIATVDRNTGVVTGVSKGTVKITATVPGSSISDTIDISVSEEGADPEVVIMGGTAVLKGQRLYLNAVVNPSSSSQTVKWSSDDTSIATVDSASGVVTGVNAGRVKITATSTVVDSDGKFVSSSVYITVTSNSIVINGGRIVAVDSTLTLTAVVPSGKKVTWSSSDTGIATVDAATGVVTGVKAGQATIRAAISSDVYETALITVIDAKSITVSPTKLWLAKDGDSEVVKASVTDSSGKSVDGVVLEVKENKYTNVTISGYNLTTKSLSTGEVTDNIKVCIKDTNFCATYQAYIYCQKWTLVNSSFKFVLGHDKNGAHLNETCYYRDLSENKCEPVKEGDKIVAYNCKSYYNRCCGTGGGGGGDTPTPSQYACYLNSTTGDYKWAIQSPGNGYVKVSNITSEANCKKPETPSQYACYVNETTGDYKWSTQSPGSGYSVNSNITSEANCKKPVQENPACYRDVANNHVWGLYQNDSNYTLVEEADTEEECMNVIEVPITARDVATIIYVFVVILLAGGIWFVYYVNHKKRLNQ